jgi:transcriptional regulator with XRE-family HTH domain
MTVNKRVMDIMKREDLTQKEFASILDISQPVLTYIANGRNKVSLDIVQKIASKYPEISLRWLILGEGETRQETTGETNLDLSKLVQELEIVNGLNNKNLSSVIFRIKKEMDK